MAAVGCGTLGFGTRASKSMSARLLHKATVGKSVKSAVLRADLTRTAAIHSRPSHFRDNSNAAWTGSAEDSAEGEEKMKDYISHVYNSMNDMETVGLTVEHDESHGTPPLLRGLDLPKLLQSMSDIQKKNTELQKQLTETVSMLSTAAEALNSYGETKQLNGVLQRNGTTVGDLNGAAKEMNGTVTEEQAVEDNLRSKLQKQAEGSDFVIQHPGTMCSTKTSVARDFDTDSCMVTVQSIARLTGMSNGGEGTKPCGVEMPHLVALAAQATVNSAAEFSRATNNNLKASLHTTRRMNAHKHIRKVLLKGQIIKAESRGASEFGHESFEVELKDPDSEQVIKAMFKPRVQGDAQGWHRAPIEAVAYKLNLLLGMDYVPPVSYRTGGIDVDFHHFEEGAFMYFSDNATELKDHDPSTWGVSKEVFLSNTRILDVLLHNSDRHHGHFLMGNHWVEGQWEGGKWKGLQRPMLIDHAAGFRKEAVVLMEHENAFQTGPVRCVSGRTYLRLRFLDAASIANSFSHFLSEREMRDMLIRRNTILRYLDNLVETQGYSNTVIE